MNGYRIEVAESCGFCFGVRRAVEMVYEPVSYTHLLICVCPLFWTARLISCEQKIKESNHEKL